MLDRGAAFTAIACASDLIAIGAIKALRENDLRVPQDIAIVGFDDIPTAEHLAPSLTTIRQDTYAAGQALVDSVLALINEQDIGSSLLPTTLVVRDSCGTRGEK